MSDWRNPEDYEYTGELSLSQWAWEFLRRSEKYQSMYLEHLVARQAVASGPVDGRIEVSYKALFASDGFGLYRMYGPEMRADQIDRLEWIVSPTISQRWNPQLDPLAPWPGYPDAVALVFDLTLPQDQQQKVVAEILDRLREIRSQDGHPKPKRVRTQHEVWTRYLRLLDAKLDGTSISEMGRVIFAGNEVSRKSAQGALRRAVEMANRGYRQLAAQAFVKGEGS